MSADRRTEQSEHGEQSRTHPLSTSTGGKLTPTVDSLPQTGLEGRESDTDQTPEADDLARRALAGAQRIARPRPNRTAKTVRRRGRTDQRQAGYHSGPAPDENDPQPIGQLLAGYVDERGWQLPLAEARVFADWAALVGEDVAAHSTPTALHDGELRVTAESTGWATQLRMLAGTLHARLVAELGPDVVTKLIIAGPSGPSWKHGGYSVRGGRGPRDTYG